MQSGKIKISSGNVQDSAFVTGGYFNWKDATRNLSHEGTSIHKKAVSVVITEPKTIGDVGEMLSSTLSAEKQTNRQYLLKVAESVKFLARQAIPYCGNGDEGNFLQSMKLCAIDVPSITTYLQCKTDKYVSPQVQNELTMIMANHILRDILSISINKAKYFALMADEVTDISNKEQVVICLRYVDDKFEPQEDFIGFCSVNSITADVLVSVFIDAMLRMNLSIQNCRGQCFDGAANMCGSKKGAATQITSVESRAVFIHCYGHALNLAIGDTIKNNKILRRAPVRFEEGPSLGYQPITPKDFYRQQYFECLDMCISCIKDRFNQPGYAALKNLEDLLIKAANNENYNSDLNLSWASIIMILSILPLKFNWNYLDHHLIQMTRSLWQQ